MRLGPLLLSACLASAPGFPASGGPAPPPAVTQTPPRPGEPAEPEPPGHVRPTQEPLAGLRAAQPIRWRAGTGACGGSAGVTGRRGAVERGGVGCAASVSRSAAVRRGAHRVGGAVARVPIAGGVLEEAISTRAAVGPVRVSPHGGGPRVDVLSG
ncbi:hypothetical protein [Saccharothrix obliqua]|uniref:hypothetical protein n=1 Tax=Saccharothrix obliqua TaxID=2861747 RepID=UPI001C5DF038|nr:hypothetical protein [Saccharothrix obliqua]MBW4716548.1 hypothetical protein [Saccharothrix obliqua]